MLHIVDQITSYECLINYDGSREELWQTDDNGQREARKGREQTKRCTHI